MPRKRPASQYDKIVKENIEAVIPALLEKVLSIHAAQSEELPDDLQHTHERRPDVLKRITDLAGDTFILQLEFQVADDPDMAYRMNEYLAMLLRKYKLPVRQAVLFLGNKTPRMATQLEFHNLRFTFDLLTIKSVDYQTFVNSNQPEQIVFGVLGDFGKVSPQRVVEAVLRRLDASTNTHLQFQKYVRQLRILAKLRKLEFKIEDIMDSIDKFIDEETDYLFIKGQKKGLEKGLAKLAKAEERFVQRLLQKTDHTPEQIADIVGVSVEFVRRVEQKLSRN
mgnify:CR=1 FL=1